MGRLRLLIGVNIFWLALSLLFDGLNTLVLPNQLLALTDDATKARTLGFITFIGLLAGMLVQPVAGAISDRLRPRWGRRSILTTGVLLALPGLLFLGTANHIVTVLAAYIVIQVVASVAQAAQQGFLPDLVPPGWRGLASGCKGFMDLTGALIGFVILGQLLESGGTRAALLVIAAVLLLSYACTVFLLHEPAPPAPPPPHRSTAAEVFRLDLRQHHSFAWLIGSRFLFLLGAYAVGRFFLFLSPTDWDWRPGRLPGRQDCCWGRWPFLPCLPHFRPVGLPIGPAACP